MKSKSVKLVNGVGVNDANYSVTKWKYVDGVRSNGTRKTKIIWICPYYQRWKGVLARCYCSNTQKRHPTYKGCTIYKDWLLFSNFRKWMVLQVWEGMEIDKDILFEGNKIYSPSTCVFISKLVNCFINKSSNRRGVCFLGCYFNKERSSYVAECSNPMIKSRGKFIGHYQTEIQAHLAWKKQKHKYALVLAGSEYVTDERVRQVLLHKYENYTIVEDHLK